MNKAPRILILILIALSLHSCFKEDASVPVHERGPVITDTIGMTDNYMIQVYFDLASGTSVRMNVKTESDLGFECSPTGWKIILNTADFMKVADLGVIPFGQLQDTAGLDWTFDKSDGNADSLAFGKWFSIVNGDTVSANHVYLIDRGMDQAGNPLGFRQLIFDSLINGTYYFRFAGLNGLNSHSGSVTKDPSVNYTWYSLAGSGILKTLEPPKDSWDLLFTQYTTLLYTDLGEAYPYLVTGVLLNPYRVAAIKDSILDFNTVTLDAVNSIPLSHAQDVIGYDWKTFDFNAGSYTVRTGIFYMVRDKSGYLYKLRFIGFYNEKGQKGYPVIEYQSL